MSAIGKGDWVQLVRAPDDADFTRWGMRMGGVYCVEAIGGEGFCSLCTKRVNGIRLAGIIQSEGVSFCPCQIRPLGGSTLTKTREAPADLVTA